MTATPSTHVEAHSTSHNSRLNSLRAGVLGANDGIVSVAALLLGVIGSGASAQTLLISGMAATIAGAVSMALGEYVSVSAQRDTERMLIEKETRKLAEYPEAEHEELATILRGYGMSDATAHQAATEIESGDALAAHLKLELGLDSEDLTNPWAAAMWSAIAFLAGAALPLATAYFSAHSMAGFVVFGVTLVALAITGYVSATLAGTNRVLSTARLLVGGAAGLAVTYGVGALFGGVVA